MPEGNPSDTVLFHASLPDSVSTSSHPADHMDSIVSTMLSLQWVKQEVGLARHILQQTSTFVNTIHQHNYYHMEITHTNDTTQNTRHRVNARSHCQSQDDEVQLTDRRLSDNMAGRWGRTTDPPAGLQVQNARVQIRDPLVPGWVFRRVARTLSATCGWSDPHCWLTATHLNFRDPDAAILNSSPHLLYVTNYLPLSPSLHLPVTYGYGPQHMRSHP